MTAERPRCGETMLHVDMDAFFASVEQLRRPELRGKPVAVGGGGPRGVVAAASYEARAYGVRSAMAMGEARRRCPHLTVVSGDMALYGEISGRIADIFSRFTPEFEMASLDEAYLDLSGMERTFGPPFRIAMAVHDAVRAETGLPCSMGLARNRLVSKIAGGLAKPHGFLRVMAGCEKEFLAPLPVELLPGVGEKTLERLRLLGVRTVGDFASVEPAFWERLFGAHGTDLFEKAQGRGATGVRRRESPRSVGHETTFAADTLSPPFLRAALADLCEQTGFRLRRHRLAGQTVTLKLRYFDFHTVTRARALAAPTNFDHVLFQAAADLLEGALADRRGRVRLLGVRVTRLRPAGAQLDLFAERRGESLYERLDWLKRRYGLDAVRLGVSGGAERKLDGWTGGHKGKD